MQLRKFLDVLTVHRKQLEAQLADLQANLEEVREHEKKRAPYWQSQKSKNDP